jgi:DNA polymerase-3 subunit beta
MSVFQTSQDKLISVLQRVSGVVEKRNTLPILANVLLEKKEQEVQVTATDLEMQIKTKFSEENAGNDAFCTTVGARKMIDILRAVGTDQPISMKLEPNRVLVQSGKSRFNLQTLPSEDFPVIKEPEAFSNRFNVSQKLLKEAFLKVSFAMAANDIRYYLNGILLVTEESGLNLVATDGHRLAYAALPLSLPFSTREELIVPRKTVLEMQRLLGDTDNEVEVCFSSTQIKFVFNEIELVSKIIEGKFPDYQKVIPQTPKNSLVLNRLGFLLALQRVSVLANEKFKGVRFEIKPGTLKVSFQNSEQEEAWDEMDIDYSGDAIEIGFNINYIVDMLNHVDQEQIKILLSDANGSALFTVPQDDNFKYVVMPMRI